MIIFYEFEYNNGRNKEIWILRSGEDAEEYDNPKMKVPKCLEHTLQKLEDKR